MFSSNADGLTLCYAFQAEPFKLYSDIPLVRPVTVSEEVALAKRQNEVRVTLTFDLDYASIGIAGSPEREIFIRELKGDISQVLGISQSRLAITSIFAWKHHSRIYHFAICRRL